MSKIRYLYHPMSHLRTVSCEKTVESSIIQLYDICTHIQLYDEIERFLKMIDKDGYDLDDKRWIYTVYLS